MKKVMLSVLVMLLVFSGMSTYALACGSCGCQEAKAEEAAVETGAEEAAEEAEAEAEEEAAEEVAPAAE